MARNDKRRPKSTAVPTAADPDRDNKYRKTRRYQKRKQLRIENEPMVRRTLRNPVRQALRKQTDANYIHPWVRENPAYRYQPRKYPSASLLGLPREVRQRIMCMLYPLPESGGQYAGYLEKSRRYERRTALCSRIGELCCVSPVLYVDMQYVRTQWEEELRKEEQVRRNQLTKHGVVHRPAIVVGFTTRQGLAKHHVINVKRGKKQSKRSRPPKCWYCEARHPQGGKHIMLHPHPPQSC
ncbi:hypothetical protein PMIN03_007248 [Paraphaeosphaeria minitans]|uniref:Uncharacterized protein n=1 Tax=Paraphaeosphaeria minitans TaxID=565426 RepID=A0A9P6GK11_9PLEO|nr:hypothetical protein PMIN01_04608 [Paraphaeosphaeria minitans]